MGRRWRRFKRRLNNPRVGGALAGACLVLAGVVYLLTRPDDTPYRDVSEIWYYDLNTRQAFKVRWGQHREVPPQPAPSGVLKEPDGVVPAGEPAGVRLFVYGCGGCSGETFHAFLQTYPDAIRAMIVDGSAFADPLSIQHNELMRRPGDADWVRTDSDAGRAIFAELRTRCGDRPPKRCEVNSR